MVYEMTLATELSAHNALYERPPSRVFGVRIECLECDIERDVASFDLRIGMTLKRERCVFCRLSFNGASLLI